MRRGPSTIDIYRHHMHSATRGTRAPWARPGMWEELLQSVDVRKECADESVRSGVLSTVALSSVHDNWTWSTLTAAHDERRRRRSWLASRMATTQGGDTGEMRSLRTIAHTSRSQCAYSVRLCSRALFLSLYTVDSAALRRQHKAQGAVHRCADKYDICSMMSQGLPVTVPPKKGSLDDTKIPMHAFPVQG